jgi:FK506-binding nuclear protein
MARKRDRIFTLTMALLFFVTGFGFSFWVIWQMATQKSSTNTANNQNQSNTTANSCTGTPTEPTLPIPSAYQPTSTVTSLETKDIIVGKGATAKNGDCLTVKYFGTLASNGMMFDENFTKTTGFKFQLGAGQVIPGWDQGLVGMKVGGERRLVIPPSLGYGNKANGSIPANSTLIFFVRLMAIN